MSIEYYIQGFREGEASGVGEADILGCFKLSKRDTLDGQYHLQYTKNVDCHLSLTTQEGCITAICIHRPVNHPSLYESIFRVLSFQGYILFAPSGNGPVAVDKRIVPHLPVDLIENLGEVIFVQSDTEILPALFDECL